MAVQAKFIADFTSFDSAVQKAETKLRTFGDGIGRIDKDLSKFGNQFSGTSLIREATLMEKAIDAIGGTSRLTKSELERAGNTAAAAAEKMRLLGIDVPDRLQNIAKHAKSSTGELTSLSSVVGRLGPMLAGAFSVGAIIGFAKEVGSFAGKMTDLSAQTGISTTRLQSLNYVAAGVGLTIEDITGGVDQLSKRLAGGDSSAAAAIERLNLDINRLQQMAPDEAFLAISRAIAQIESPMERTRTSMELFGRSGARMLRLMTDDLDGLIGKAEESGAVISKELIDKADAFDDAWSQAILHVKASLVAFIADVPSLVAKLNPLTGNSPHGAASAAGSSLLGAAGSLANRAVFGALPNLPRSPGGVAFPQSLPEILNRQQLGNLIDADKTKAAADLKAAAAAEKFASEAEKFADSLSDFQATVFRQGAAANAKGELGFLAGATAIDKSTAGFFPDPSRLAARFGNPAAFNLLPPTIGGQNNVFPSGPGLTDRLKGFGSSALSSLKSAFNPSNLVSGFITGGLNQLGGLAIKGITAGFKKLFGGLFGNKEVKQVNDLRDAFIDSAGGISALAEQAREAGTSVDQLLKAKTVKDFEAAVTSLQGKLGAFANEQEADAARLEAAIQKYGFSFEEAGAAFQKTKLDEQAKELIEDWRVLVGAGIDLGLVNEKMAGSINEYLQTAIKVGAEVPNAFRPILQKMLEQGTLTDEAGNAITDLEGAGIHFAETMTEGFDRVVAKLDELIGKLQAAGTAIGNLPSVPSLTAPDSPLFDPTQSDLPGYVRGTGGRFVNFGAGTPVMLHGRERVMREGEEAVGWSGVASRLDALSDDLRRALDRLPGHMVSAVLTAAR